MSLVDNVILRYVELLTKLFQRKIFIFSTFSNENKTNEDKFYYPVEFILAFIYDSHIKFVYN